MCPSSLTPYLFAVLPSNVFFFPLERERGIERVVVRESKKRVRESEMESEREERENVESVTRWIERVREKGIENKGRGKLRDRAGKR